MKLGFSAMEGNLENQIKGVLIMNLNFNLWRYLNKKSTVKD